MIPVNNSQLFKLQYSQPPVSLPPWQDARLQKSLSHRKRLGEVERHATLAA
jgi:hypothetical protein